MDFQQIQELIQLLNESNIGEFKLESEDIKLSIRTKHFFDANQIAKMQQFPVNYATPILQSSPPPVSSYTQTSLPSTSEKQTNNQSKDVATSDNQANVITIKSPMIGTFYRSKSPDTPPYIKVGDTINPGTVLCIIEAMKLFNEIESEVNGRIVKMLVDDAAPVEFDQPLFLVEPV